MTDINAASSGSADYNSESNANSIPLNESRLTSLRAAGFSDAQIEALLSLADPDDQGNSLTPTHFYSVNKTALNALQYTADMDEDAQRLVYIQAPVAMVQEVSNPANWQGDNYVGPGAGEINTYLSTEPLGSSGPSLDAVVFSVLSARAEVLDTQLRDQIGSIEEKNEQLERANGMLARARELKGQAGTGVSTMPQDMKEFFDAIGAYYVPGDDLHSTSDWERNIDGLRSRMEALTSSSQLETTKLQQTINKYNQSFEMLSNFVSKYYQSLNTVIQNLR